MKTDILSRETFLGSFAPGMRSTRNKFLMANIPLARDFWRPGEVFTPPLALACGLRTLPAVPRVFLAGRGHMEPR